MARRRISGCAVRGIKKAMQRGRLPAGGVLAMVEELLETGLADLLDLLSPANVRCRGEVPAFSTVAYAVRTLEGAELHFSWPPGAPRALLEVSERRASLLLGEFRIEMPETWVPELWGRISGALAACERRRASG